MTRDTKTTRSEIRHMLPQFGKRHRCRHCGSVSIRVVKTYQSGPEMLDQQVRCGTCKKHFRRVLT